MTSPGASTEHLDWDGFACGVSGLGPGRRLVMWVRGCSLGCPGCLAPELWEPGTPTAVDEIAAALAPHLAGHDGLTISGGEPFQQAAALLALLARLPDVELMLYSGYRLAELEATPGPRRELLARCDLLMDGRFEESTSAELAWRGSDNQRLHLLSERGRRHEAWCDAPAPEPRLLQLQPLAPERYRLIGIPKRHDLAAYRRAMAARGWKVAKHE